MAKILGLDLGVSSIGWSLIEQDNESYNGKIVASGVRIFQGNEKRADSAPGESSNADRRTKRSVRRQRDRRTRRKINLYVTLKQNGMAPNKSVWDEWVSINPYIVRAKALDEKVALHEFGRALYHLNQRRGYKSNRKAGSDKEGAVKEGISKVRKHMAKHNARTIGEYFYKIYDNHLQEDIDHDDFERRIRDKYTHRKMFKEEFDALWKAQSTYHNELTDDLGKEIKKIIFHQRKMKSQSHLIGKCELETDKKLLPYLRKGFEESTAIKKAGYSLFEQNPGKMNQLPMPDQSIKNPVVYHALVELRKVANGIIRRYGMPDTIRVELARDLKVGYERRQKMTKKMRKLEKRNEQTRKALQKAPFNVKNPGYDDLLWYNLWQECEQRCPYTGKTIPAESFNSGEFQVEHIIPFSRSLDNSFANKTLCEADFNRKKGNRTPWECVQAGIMDEETLLQRIRNLPWNKRNKFTQKDIDVDNFLNRQLNDTRYISREASSYLKHLACKNIEVVKGQTTSLLRHLWGLNSVLNKEDDEMKNRDDHRHHAIDAIVVAFTNRATLKRLSDENKMIRTPSWMDSEESGSRANDEMKRRIGQRIDMAAPWPYFRKEVEKSINDIVVSHRVNRKVSGAFHEETYYGPTDEYAPKNKEMMVLRKPVHQLSKRDLGLIRDNTVREIVNNKVQEIIDEQGVTQPTAITALETDPPYIVSSKAKTPIKKVRLLMKKDPQIMHHFENGDGEKYRAALYGNNHHIAIYETTDKNGEKKQVGKVVPMMEASRRVKDGEPIVMKDFRPDHSFMFSLAINNMIINHEDEEIYRVQKIESSGKITFRHQNIAMKGSSDPGVLRKMPNTIKASKIKTSPIGEVFPAND